jgi:hypothetical protein
MRTVEQQVIVIEDGLRPAAFDSLLWAATVRTYKSSVNLIIFAYAFLKFEAVDYCPQTTKCRSI